MTTWPLQSGCDSFYGRPPADAASRATWEKNNLVTVKTPWTLTYEGKPVAGIRIHKNAAASLKKVLAAIWDRYGKSQSAINATGLSRFSGSYNYRPKRGGSTLSMHSYGAAIDFDASNNSFGDKTPSMPRPVVEEFEREGWEWGGHWSKPDGMHFQAAWTRSAPARLTPPKVSTPVPAPSKPQAPAKPSKFGGEPEVSYKVWGPRGVALPQVKDFQIVAQSRGYYLNGTLDGMWGPLTSAAYTLVRAENGLDVDIDGVRLPEITAALRRGTPRELPAERAMATAASLVDKSPTVAEGQKINVLAKIGGAVGTVYAAGSAVVDAFPDAVAKLDPIKAVAPAGVSPWIWLGLSVAVATGLAYAALKIASKSNKVVDTKVNEVRTGGRL